MNYPLLSEYISSLRSAEENFEELKNLRLVLQPDNQPFFSSGNFAVVFKMKDEITGKLHAVKCFTRDQPLREERYRQIAEELEFIHSSFLTPIHYLEKELFVNSQNSTETEFPVLLMDWVEGKTLDAYLRTHAHNRYALEMLAYQFGKLATWLMAQSLAHGDLKADNILVKEDGSLVLVDYDGMYVPAMKGLKTDELGSPDYRHPLRTNEDFNEHIDDFSLISIALSLKAISLNPELLSQIGASDRLLFTANDYRDLSKCEILKDIYVLQDDNELNKFLGMFLIACAQKDLSSLSFRLFELSRPKIREVEVLSTTVTDEDLEDCWVGEFGVKYSKDKKRLLQADYIKRFDRGDVPHRNFKSESYSVIEGTRVVCDMAFCGCDTLKSIHLPEGVTSIGRSAFADCSSLKSIHLPETLTSIGGSAFFRCKSLQSIHFPETLTSIGGSAFVGCSSLKSIHLPEGVTSIGRFAFVGCSSLKSIHLPETLTSIGDSAFCRCFSLRNITNNSPFFTIDDNILYNKEKTILITCFNKSDFLGITETTHDSGDSVFYGCFSLQNIYLPKSVTSIADSAFEGCSSLQSIHLSEGITSIGKSAFYKCSSLQNIHLPKSVTSIAGSAFEGCSSLQSIHLSEGITSIGKSAFYKCSSLQNIHLPKSVTSIADSAFEGCSSLQSIHLPETLTSIGGSAFVGCSSLQNIHLPKSVTSIANSAFNGCSSLQSIHLPEGVTSIGNEAFRGCSSLKSIHLPEGLTSIGYSAFSDCSSLESIHFPEGLTSIGKWAFSACPSLKSIFIPSGTLSKFKNLLPSGLHSKLREQ